MEIDSGGDFAPPPGRDQFFSLLSGWTRRSAPCGFGRMGTPVKKSGAAEPPLPKVLLRKTLERRTCGEAGQALPPGRDQFSSLLSSWARRSS